MTHQAELPAGTAYLLPRGRQLPGQRTACWPGALPQGPALGSCPGGLHPPLVTPVSDPALALLSFRFPGQGQGPRAEQPQTPRGYPWDWQGRGPEAAGKHRTQGRLWGSGPCLASAVVPTAVPTLPRTGRPAPLFQAAMNQGAPPDQRHQAGIMRPAGQGSPARPSDLRAEDRDSARSPGQWPPCRSPTCMTWARAADT